MDWLERIDWTDHDGVNLPMINDVVRNSFYDNIIRGNVRNRNCLDIGFGTGLLSLMALKYGARHVTAFESNPDRYELGKFIINRLGLKDRISLVNQRFHKGMIVDYPEVNVIFHEAVGRNLWDEGIWKTFNEFNCAYLPGQYLVEICALPVDRSFAQGLLTLYRNYHFNPGVNVYPGFVDLINELLSQKYAQQTVSDPLPTLIPGMHRIKPTQTIFNKWNPQHHLIDRSTTLVSKYIIDVNRQLFEMIKNQQIVKKEKLDLNMSQVDMDIRLDKSISDTWVLIPRVGLKHDDHVLYLDQGSWGPANYSIILHKIQQDNIVVQHGLYDGKFRFLLTE